MSEKWFHTLQTRNINKRGGGPSKFQGFGKNQKITKCPLPLLGAYQYSPLFKTEMNNHKCDLWIIVSKSFEPVTSSEQLIFQISEKRKTLNWYTNSMIFYIVWITIVNKSSENKMIFQKYWMAFPYLQILHFLDWFCTIKEVCAMFLDVKFLKRELLKNEIIFAHFFPYLTHVFLTRKIFCYRNQKVCML